MNNERLEKAEAMLLVISNWLVCEAITTPEDMAQSFTPMREMIDEFLAESSGVHFAMHGLTDPDYPRANLAETGIVLRTNAKGEQTIKWPSGMISGPACEHCGSISCLGINCAKAPDKVDELCAKLEIWHRDNPACVECGQRECNGECMEIP